MYAIRSYYAPPCSPQTPATSSSGNISASGVVAPAQQIAVTSAISGNLKSVDVAAGEQVRAGQVLASFTGVEKLTAAVEANKYESYNFV